jgi:hypothetical protein
MANKPTVFNGATGAKSPVVTAHVIAFIKANNGLGNVALQLTPNAIGKNGVLFGGGKLTTALQPNKQGVLGGRASILWACIHGWVNGKPVATNVPKTVPSAVPLSTIQLAHTAYKASVFANANTPQFGNTNQNAVVALLNGGFSPACKLYGTAFAKLVLV